MPKSKQQLALSVPSKRTKVSRDRETGAITVEVAKSLDEILLTLGKYVGTRNDEVAVRIVGQVVSSMEGALSTEPGVAAIQAISAIEEMDPQNLTQSMLAAQTIGTHEAATKFLRLAMNNVDQTLEARSAHVTYAIRLMRLHLEQIEAMQKLKGKTGQQKVIVEHVNVLAGGQAIVGAVEASRAPGGGG